MNKRERIVSVMLLLAGVAVAAITFNSYIEHPNEIEDTVIGLEAIPFDSEKVDNMESVNVSYQDVSYGKGQQEEFVSASVHDLLFFKTKKLDIVYISLGKDIYGRHILSVRGINKAELPLVHDYWKEVTIGEAKPAFTISVFRETWYNSFPSLNKTDLGWTLNTKYPKIDFDLGIVRALLWGIFGVVAAIFLLLIVEISWKIIKYTAKLKLEKSE